MSIASGIENFLINFLGEGGSRRFILVFCAKYNLQPDQLSAEHLPEMGAFLRANIRIFVGAEKAQAIIEQLGSGI